MSLQTKKQPQNNGKTLFCACLEIWRNGEWIARKDYLHADDVGEARAKVTVAHPNRNLVRIIGVAQVIGYHVEDNHGDRLIV
jgi:hypothetical protein